MQDHVLTDLQQRQQQEQQAKHNNATRRISNLGKVEQFLQRLHQDTQTFKSETDPKTYLRKLLRRVHKVRTTKGLPTGAGKPLMRVQNELTSLYEGARTNALTSKDFYIDEPKRQLDVVRKLRLKAIERLALEAQDISPREFAVESGYEDFSQALADTNKPEREIVVATLKRTGYIVGRHSVVPIMNAGHRFVYDLAVQEKLEVRSLAGYVAVDNQLVLGVPLATDTDDLEERIQALESSVGASLDFVAEKPYAFAGASWYWLAPVADIDKMARCCPQGLNVQSWGFL